MNNETKSGSEVKSHLPLVEALGRLGERMTSKFGGSDAVVFLRRK